MILSRRRLLTGDGRSACLEALALVLLLICADESVDLEPCPRVVPESSCSASLPEEDLRRRRRGLSGGGIWSESTGCRLRMLIC